MSYDCCIFIILYNQRHLLLLNETNSKQKIRTFLVVQTILFSPYKSIHNLTLNNKQQQQKILIVSFSRELVKAIFSIPTIQ